MVPVLAVPVGSAQHGSDSSANLRRSGGSEAGSPLIPSSPRYRRPPHVSSNSMLSEEDSCVPAAGSTSGSYGAMGGHWGSVSGNYGSMSANYGSMGGAYGSLAGNHGSASGNYGRSISPINTMGGGKTDMLRQSADSLLSLEASAAKAQPAAAAAGAAVKEKSGLQLPFIHGLKGVLRRGSIA